MDFNDTMSLNDWIPMYDPMSINKFYRYMGGLTTPPCSEVVNWFVFEDPIYVSQAQVLWASRPIFLEVLDKTLQNFKNFDLLQIVASVANPLQKVCQIPSFVAKNFKNPCTFC